METVVARLPDEESSIITTIRINVEKGRVAGLVECLPRIRVTLVHDAN